MKQGPLKAENHQITLNNEPLRNEAEFEFLNELNTKFSVYFACPTFGALAQTLYTRRFVTTPFKNLGAQSSVAYKL